MPAIAAVLQMATNYLPRLLAATLIIIIGASLAALAGASVTLTW